MSDKDISQMDFKELRNEVQMLRDELAIMQRKYEDILYNLDYDNFGAEVKKDLTSIVSSDEVESMISQTASQILSRVNNIEGDYSQIVQDVASIEMTVEDLDGLRTTFRISDGEFYFDGDIAKFTGAITLTDNNLKHRASLFVSESNEGVKCVRLWTNPDAGGIYPLVLGNDSNDGVDVYLGRYTSSGDTLAATQGFVEDCLVGLI